MEIVLALVSSVLFALGSVLQQKAGVDAPSVGTSSGLLLRMARRRVWLAGIGSDALGFVAQAAALGVGRLAVVQPLLVTSVVFALPLGVRLTGLRAHRSDAAAAALLALGGRHGPPPRRAVYLGAAAGILFALSAALTKAVVDELHRGVFHVLGSWELYALAAVGYTSMTLNQLALNTGALAATLATTTALDPIASVVLGLTVFHESPHAGAAQVPVALVALGAALGGMVVLARAEAHLPAPTSAQ